MTAVVRRPLLAAVLVLPGTVTYFGVVFDVAWHIDNGRDHFDIPPHLVMIAGMQAGGILLALLTLHARRARSALAPLALVALGCFVAPGVAIGLDEGWHRLYGLDVSAWSPTHLTALYSAALGGLAFAAFLAAELNAHVPGRASRAARRIRDLDRAELWLVYVLGLFGAGLLVLLVEYEFDVPQSDFAFAAVLLAALTAFPVFAGRAALGARLGGTLVAAAIIAVKLATLLVLLAFGRIHPDLPAGILVAALAADLLLVRGRTLAALAAYPVVLLGAEWLRLALLGQPQWTDGLWPLGAPLAVPAAMLAGALGLLAGWALRPAGEPLARPAVVRAWGARLAPAAVLIASLAVAVPALGHAGLTREVVRSTLAISPAAPSPGDVVRVRVTVGARTLDGRTPPFLASPAPELGAFRGGDRLEAPLRRTGPRTYEGALRLAGEGRWVIWPKWRVGDERWIDRTHLTVARGAPDGGVRTFETVIAPEADPASAPGWLRPLGYAAMLAIWLVVTVAVVRSLRLVMRLGFAEAGAR